MPNRADRDALRTSRGDEPDRQEQMRPVKPKEFRIYGLNACIAAFKKRPESVRKLWLLESRIPKLQELLAFCVKNRIGYNVVENEDLEKLTGSAHHEGVCLALLPQPELNLSQWLMNAPAGGCLLLWLDGVGNPHNLGAIMRSAAHFGVQAILLPKTSALSHSGAAARVAEGGAEHVPLIRLGRTDNAIAQLASAGFTRAEFVAPSVQEVQTAWGRFAPAWDLLQEDLNVPGCLGQIFTVVGDKAEVSPHQAREDLCGLAKILFALGVGLFAAKAEVAIPAEVAELGARRWAAKQSKDFAAADQLRKDLTALGWTMLDRKDGYDLKKA